MDVIGYRGWCFCCGISGIELKTVEGVPGFSPYDVCADYDACMERMGASWDGHRWT